MSCSRSATYTPKLCVCYLLFETLLWKVSGLQRRGTSWWFWTILLDGLMNETPPSVLCMFPRSNEDPIQPFRCIRERYRRRIANEVQCRPFLHCVCVPHVYFVSIAFILTIKQKRFVYIIIGHLVPPNLLVMLLTSLLNHLFLLKNKQEMWLGWWHLKKPKNFLRAALSAMARTRVMTGKQWAAF